MKKCNRCGLEKSEEEFAWRWQSRGIRQRTCRECQREQHQKWYKKHGDKHRKHVRKKTREKKEELKQYIWKYLSTHPCVDCGESNPVVLEFDHVKGKKNKSIARMVSDNYSLEAIQREISKCVVRCANCHRIKTHKERGWFKGKT